MSKAQKKANMRPGDVIRRIAGFKTFPEVLDRLKEMRANAGESWTLSCTNAALDFANKFKGGNSHQARIRVRAMKRTLA